jgi:hypothetical protein
MNRYLLLFWLGMYLFANPIAEVIINEFEVTPSDSERIEFRYFRSASNDTIYSDSFSLLNLHLYTPAGVSFIDTQVYLPGMGYRVIDASFLSGNFGLPDDSGFIKVDSGGFISLYDSVPYPQLAPTPPINCSAAKFHFYYWDMGGYNLVCDWYIDSTPTFGADNDDYPGCLISGNVFATNGSPIENAKVIAVARGYAYILNPPPYYKTCTTYTDINGYFMIDSLLPWSYNVKISAPGYLPDSQSIYYLCWKNPATNLNFYLLGISEFRTDAEMKKFFIYPNPASNILYINMDEPLPSIEFYDITGRMIKRFKTERAYIDCSSLPRGIYFIKLPVKGAVLRKVILL